MFDFGYFLAFVLIFLTCIRLLHMNSKAEWPQLFYQENQPNSTEEKGFIAQILSHAPIFTAPYIPPLIWGRSGHLQTIIHSTISRHLVPREKGDSRHEVLMSDGSLLTFDLFQPLHDHIIKSGVDVTLAVCPGIGNSSETVALKTFSNWANVAGYRVAVLNHLGVIPSIPLTTPRIFSYGSTEEYGLMVDWLRQTYTNTNIVSIGFSMGGNIVCKYLGEDQRNRDRIIGGASVCQGYKISRLTSANRNSTVGVMSVNGIINSFYLKAIGLTVYKVLRQFEDVLLSESVLERFGLTKEDITSSGTDIEHIDDIFLSKLHGFGSREEYWEASSSSNYIPNIKDFPMLFINSVDDPLVPKEVLQIPKTHAESNSMSMFCLTKHGGHLGFYECQPGHKFFHRGTYTWCDKAIIEWVSALVRVTIAGAALAGQSDKEEEGIFETAPENNNPIEITI